MKKDAEVTTKVAIPWSTWEKVQAAAAKDDRSGRSMANKLILKALEKGLDK